MGSDKVRENLLRRQAKRRGLRLVKSRRRDPRAPDFGRYVLIDERTGAPVGDASGSLDAVAGWLDVDDEVASTPGDHLFTCQWCGEMDAAELEEIAPDGTCRVRCEKCHVLQSTRIPVTQLRALVRPRLITSLNPTYRPY